MTKIKIFDNAVGSDKEINNFIASVNLIGGANAITVMDTKIVILYNDNSDPTTSIQEKVSHLRSLMKGHDKTVLDYKVSLAELEIDLAATEGSDEAKEAITKNIKQTEKFLKVAETKLACLENLVVIVSTANEVTK